MKSPAELYVESLTFWPEPMGADNLTSSDWHDVAGIITNTHIEQTDANVGLSLVAAIESQGLTIENFQGNVGLFVFAFNSLMKTASIDRIKKFHKMHGQSIVDWFNNDSNGDRTRQAEFYTNIFTPKEA